MLRAVSSAAGCPGAAACGAPLELEAIMTAYGPTLLRLVLGALYVMHAYLILFMFGTAGWVGFATRYGVPLPQVLVWFVVLAHGLGGAALIIGLWTRWAALANAIVMAGAVLFVYLNTGFFLRAAVVDAAKGTAMRTGSEFELLLLGATVAQILLGGGALAVTKDT
jgi:putative oxidoreductase